MHILINTYICTCIYEPMYTHIHTCIYIHAYINPSMHACMHTYTHAYIHTNIYRLFVYTHTDRSPHIYVYIYHMLIDTCIYVSYVWMDGMGPAWSSATAPGQASPEAGPRRRGKKEEFKARVGEGPW